MSRRPYPLITLGRLDHDDSVMLNISAQAGQRIGCCGNG